MNDRNQDAMTAAADLVSFLTTTIAGIDAAGGVASASTTGKLVVVASDADWQVFQIKVKELQSACMGLR